MDRIFYNIHGIPVDVPVVRSKSSICCFLLPSIAALPYLEMVADGNSSISFSARFSLSRDQERDM